MTLIGQDDTVDICQCCVQVLSIKITRVQAATTLARCDANSLRNVFTINTNIVANMLGTPPTDETPTILQQVGNMLSTILPPTDKILPHPNILTMSRCWALAIPEPNNVVERRPIGTTVFDHVIADAVDVNNRTDDDASIFERKCGIFP